MHSSFTDLHTRELPRWVRDLLASPPVAGTGLHQWLYRVACALRPRRADEDIIALLTAATIGCGRDLRREIIEAVTHAQSNWQPGHQFAAPLVQPPRQRPAWPARDLKAISAIAAEGAGMAAMLDASPERLEGDRPDAEEIVDMLFPRDALLCVARAPEDARTLPREAWRGKLASHSLIVPSPMTATTGKRKDGTPSNRCLDNTGPRRFLVVEFDFNTNCASGSTTPEAPLLNRLAREGRSAPDLCAALLLHLARYAPLALAVYSGGKSLHGWFPALGIPESTLISFFRLAVRLGADPATWTRCQLIRLPGGLRNNGSRQRVWFLNRAVIPSPTTLP